MASERIVKPPLREPTRADSTPAESIRARSSLADVFAPLSLWIAASIGLLALAAIGPKLFASQRTDDAALAVEIVAAGQVLLAAIAWPIWTRSFTAALGVIVAAPVWLLLAGQLAQRPNGDVIELAWKLITVLVTLGIVRRVTPRAALGVVWSIITALAIGVPAISYLARDF